MDDDEYLEELESAVNATVQKKKSARKSYKGDINPSKKKFRDDTGYTLIDSAPSKHESPSLLLQTPTPMSILIPKSGLDQSLPQPSPAACGKRKEAELAAAQMLASSSTREKEGAQLLSMMKTEMSYDSIKKRQMGLSIINPEEMEDGATWGIEPTTPWEQEVRALEESKDPSTFCGQVSTPSEQKFFLSKLIDSIRKGNVAEVKGILRAVEEASGTKLSSLSTPMSPPQKLPDAFKSESDESTNLDGKGTPTSACHATTKMNKDGSDNWGTALSRILNKAEHARDTALFIACSCVPADNKQQNVVDICHLLIDHGANACLVDDKVGTCLHLVANNGYDAVARLLLNRGCSANEVDENGDTAMHIAARCQFKDFLYLLITFGANCHVRNAKGRAAIDIVDELTNTGISLEKQVLKRDEIRSLLFSLEPRLRTLVLYHEDCLEHFPRRQSDWEGPDRLKCIMSQLNNSNLFRENELEISTQFDKAPVELLSRVHSPEYITFVDSLSKQMQRPSGADEATPVPFTPQVQRFLLNQNTNETKNGEYSDTAFSAGTLSAARRAAGAVAHAVDRVLMGRNRNAFCVVRPPGHHAGYGGLLDGGRSCGFCIFNSVAAGAYHALEAHKCERVAIIDLDIHHGNGTEDIVRRYPNPSRLFFYSVHLFEKDEGYEFFPGTGAGDDAAHNIVNVPIYPLWGQECAPPGAVNEIEYGRIAYRKAITERLLPALRAFNPSLILMSTGFDAGMDDVGNTRVVANGSRVQGMDLRPDDFEWATSEVMNIADITCNGRLVSVLEGGYGSYTQPARKTRATARAGGYAEPLESDLNRQTLAVSTSSHVRRLVDPYNRFKTVDTSNDVKSEQNQD